MYTDSHNHTNHFSGDAHMTAADLMAAAKANNLDAVVITEHYEYDFPHEVDHSLVFDMDEYFEAFTGWSKNTPAGLSLYSGIELGYQPHLAAYYDSLVAKYPFDSVILSNHLFNGKDPYFFQECYKNPKKQVYSKYIGELADMVLASSNFDIVGHYDYIMRYAGYEDSLMRYEDAPESFDRFFRAIIQKKKSLEINTRSISKLISRNTKDFWPDRKILERYIELGGDRVTLGSDSHDTSSLGFFFEETASYLKDCGFKDITTYVGRKEIRTPIS